MGAASDKGGNPAGWRLLDLLSTFLALVLVMFLPFFLLTSTAPAADLDGYRRVFGLGFVAAAGLLAAVALPLHWTLQRAEEAALEASLREAATSVDVAAVARRSGVPLLFIAFLAALSVWGVSAAEWLQAAQIPLGAAAYTFVLLGLPVAAALAGVHVATLYRFPVPLAPEA